MKLTTSGVCKARGYSNSLLVADLYVEFTYLGLQSLLPLKGRRCYRGVLLA